MNPTPYSGPYRGQIRALERNIMKYRAMQMALIIHYAEELRQTVISTIQTNDQFHKRLHDSEFVERAPKGSKDPFNKAIKAWVSDGLLTDEEAEEIKRLTDFRNDIAHRIHYLSADLSQLDSVQRSVRLAWQGFPQHDYSVVARMQKCLKLLSRRITEHQKITLVRFNSVFFETAEKTLRQELSALDKKIERLVALRKEEHKSLRKEIEAIKIDFPKGEQPGHPLDTYDSGRLTRRGEEQVYRMFDKAYSSLAVAHVMRLSIVAARKRRSMWEAIGGRSRPATDIHQLPKRKFYARAED